jgi:NADPH-dependent stearoyl-CoA 9-desaturase
VTAMQNKPTSPIVHLSGADIEALGRELDAIRERVAGSRGESDASYIRRVIATQRALELSSRLILLGSLFPPAWLLGTAGLSIAKILENMEIGHNVMHGQWDWMRDPKIHSTTWEWDNASPSDMWKHSHNELHHTYTNVVGKDNDLGYGIMRVDEDQRWVPFYLFQPLWNAINAVLFQYGIAAYDLEIGKVVKGRTDKSTFKKQGRKVLGKIRKQMTRDYLMHPLLSGPSAVTTFGANLTANLVRNLWTHSVIMCGHFPSGVETFTKKSIDGETRGEWYLRQMLGAANISGGPALHMMTGNLSFQIEHHLFPDLPSNRYQEIAPQVQDVFERYGLHYAAGPMPKQLASAWWKVIRLSLPNDYAARMPGGDHGSGGQEVRQRGPGLIRLVQPGRVTAADGDQCGVLDGADRLGCPGRTEEYVLGSPDQKHRDRDPVQVSERDRDAFADAQGGRQAAEEASEAGREAGPPRGQVAGLGQFIGPPVQDALAEHGLGVAPVQPTRHGHPQQCLADAGDRGDPHEWDRPHLLERAAGGSEQDQAPDPLRLGDGEEQAELAAQRVPYEVDGLDAQLGQDAAQDRENVLADVSPGRQDAFTR